MQNVVRFPRVHAQALDTSRAAKAMSLSEVTPFSRARSVDKIADHLSEGILSRCHHLDTADDRTPISEANASFEGQRSITLLNDLISVAIPRRLGQLVLKRKDKVALDGEKFLGHSVRMAESETEAQFKQSFTERVKAARIATGLKQWQVADLLGIPQDKYKQYEGRSLLPHALVGRFCTICRVNPEWLFTGVGQKPLRPPHLVETGEPKPVPKSKRARRSKAA
jgi:DNA-binding transcriptional regulator YiaG